MKNGLKFKIGDRVVIVNCIKDIGYRKYIGKLGTISPFPFIYGNEYHTKDGRYNVTLDIDIGKAHYTCFKECDLELIEEYENQNYEEWIEE